MIPEFTQCDPQYVQSLIFPGTRSRVENFLPCNIRGEDVSTSLSIYVMPTSGWFDTKIPGEFTIDKASRMVCLAIPETNTIEVALVEFDYSKIQPVESTMK